MWGIWHGVFQIIEKMLGQQKCEYGWFGKTIKIIITFLLINFAWIFFRMPTLGDACGVIKRIFDFSLPMNVYIDYGPNLPLTIIGVTLLIFKDVRDEFFPNKFLLMNNKHFFIRWGCYLSLIAMILLMGVLGSDQFIYANF